MNNEKANALAFEALTSGLNLSEAPIENSQHESQQQAHEQTQSQPNEGTSHDVLDELIEDFDTDKPIEQPELIGGMFVRGYVNWLVGQSGSTKSWQEIRWCKDISRGGEIFGGFAHNQEPRKCLILAGELPADEMKRRAQILEKGGELKHNKENLKIVDLRKSERKGVFLQLNSQEGRKNIINIIQRAKTDILFIDSLISFNEGNESKYEDMKPVIDWLERIADDNNIAVVVIHHIRKRLPRERMNPLNQDDVIGSSTILRKAGVVIGVEFNSDTKTATVTCLKSWFEEFKPFTYKLVSGLYQGLRMEINLNPDTLTQSAKSTSHTPDWKPILMAFLHGKGDAGATVAEINNALNRDKDSSEAKSTKGQLSRLCESHEIERVERGIYRLPKEKVTCESYKPKVTESYAQEPSHEPKEQSIEDDYSLSLDFEDNEEGCE